MPRSTRMSVQNFLAAFALFFTLIFAGVAHAQSSTSGAITGTVADANGALLPDVMVKVENAATGASRAGKSNKSGEFRIPELPPGVYSVTITAEGFETFQQDIVTVTVGQTVALTPKLTIGKITDKIEVTDAPPELHVTSNEISTVIDQAQIDNLPINGRRYSDFALLTPGVVSNADGFGLLSFRGISYLLNNTTIDGADDNQAYFSEARGRTRTSYSVALGAVQEFQVNTSNYSAEYGRAAGGVINTVTKSGSNKLRGQVFFYDRDNSLGGAQNPYTVLSNFDPVNGYSSQGYKPKDWRKQFGFAVGGKLIKDKLFWFYAYDRSKRNFPGTARTTDPTDLLALAKPLSGAEACNAAATTYGHFDYGAPQLTYTAPNGKDVNGTSAPIPFSVTANLTSPSTTAEGYPVGQPYQGNFGACALAAAINPAQASGALPYQQAMAYYNQGLGVINTFFGAVPRFQDQSINFPKLDYQISDREHLTLQYNRLRDDTPNGVQTQTSNFYGRGSFGNDFVKTDVGVVRLSSVLTNSIVNNALVQYGRDIEPESPSIPTPNEQPLLNNLPAGECSAPNGKCPALPPDIGIGYGYDAAGFDIGASAIQPRYALPDERRLQLKDDVTWSKGKHTFKFGLDYNKVSDFINNLYNGYGTYDYDWAYTFIGDYLHKTTNLGGSTYAGNSLNGGYFNTGLFSGFSQGFAIPTASGDTAKGATGLITTREYAGYATDDWRITPRLTLTLGVRYEYEYIPANPTPNPDLAGANTFFAPTANHPNTYSTPDDRNNVAPRVGFNFNVFGDGKTTLRGGFGMYYGRIINSNVLQTYQNSGGPGSQTNYGGFFSDYKPTTVNNIVNPCNVAFAQLLTLATAQACSGSQTNASSHPTVSYLDSNLQNPTVYESDLALEQDLGHGLVFGVTYMSSFGRNLNSSVDTNLNLASSQVLNYAVVNNPVFLPTIALALPHGGKPAPLVPGLNGTVPVKVFTGARYDPAYYRVLRISSNVNTNYNALAFQVNKRYRNGFSLLSNFTWSHALDFNPYIGTGVPSYNVLDPGNLDEEYGNSSLDVRRRFVAAIVYQPQTHFHGLMDYALGGWRLAPVFQAQSGLPYTPYVSGYPFQSASGVRSANGSGSSAGRIEEIRRNQYFRPKTVKADVRLSKSFYFDVKQLGLDRARFQLSGEAFNIANHQNITGIQNTAYKLGYDANGNNSLTLAPNFGTYTNSNSNTVYSPRQFQLSGTFYF